MATLKFEISVAFAVCLVVALIVCIVVLTAVFILAIIQRKSPVYIISTGHIFVDIIMLSTFLFYLIPCALADDYIFPGGRYGAFGKLFAFLFEFAWIYVTFSQIFMALNRLVVVCFPGREIFNFFTVSIITLGLFPTAGVISVLASFVLPCCPIFFNHHLLAYNYELRDDYINASNLFVNVPINCVSSIISLICYTYIFVYLKKSTKLVNAGNQVTRKRQRKREIMYSLQFCAISLFHFLEWTSFRILPRLIDMTSVEFQPSFIIVGIFVCLNSSMNSLVYLFCNQEIRNTLKLILGFIMGKSATSVRTVSVTPSSMGGSYDESAGCSLLCIRIH